MITTLPPKVITRPSIRIDFVSDVVCPWCAIGLASLEIAIQRVQHDIDVDLHVQPFEPNPQLGPGGEDAVAHLRAKYGLDEAQVAANQERIRARGTELGFVFDMARRRHVYNTFQKQGSEHLFESVLDPCPQPVCLVGNRGRR